MAGRVKKYFIFAKSGIQTTLAYRGMIGLWFFGGIVNAVVLCLLWWAVFSFSPESAIAGYTFPQMLLYVMMSTIVGEMTYSDTMGLIGDDVRDGVIGMRLMKPVNYRAQLGFTNIGAFAARVIMIGLPMTIVATLICVFGFGLTGIMWYNVLLFIPALILAVLFADTLGFLFGQLAFRTQAMFGVHSIMNVLTGFLSGALVPLALFPLWAQNVLAFTPFPSMLSLPVQIFMGKISLADMGVSFAISVAWLLVLNIVGELCYRGSVRHVVVFGG